MNDIDILEEKEKKAIRMCDVLFISLDEIYKDGAQEYRMYYKTIKNLIETLISENKELKENSIPKSKVRELAKKYEFALNGYDSSIADYKHSQNIGKYMGYIELLENDNHIPHID